MRLRSSLVRRSSSLSIGAAALLAGASSALFAVCGPFTDVAADTFCPLVREIFYLGITTGTSPTTYDPTANVSRLQMAAFLSRTVDLTLKRGSRRAAMNQFWVPQNETVLDVTTAGMGYPAYDGLDVWVPSFPNGTVSRVRPSDGGVMGVWTGAPGAQAVLCAIGKVFATAGGEPGTLYRVEPREGAGTTTAVTSVLGVLPDHLTFDGARIWTANAGMGGLVGSVSIVTPEASIPWTVTTVTAGFSSPRGAIFDGKNVWITDFGAGTLLKLDSVGAVLQTVTVGAPKYPIFDGTNIWVPGLSALTVVRAASGAILASLTGNGLDNSYQAAFDGERILVTNLSGHSVSLWKAADLTAIGTYSTGASSFPHGACSDGVNFFVALSDNRLVRF